ncbi:hypothetical protein [Croceivirga sp. JEA036]|uniref:hypothetical protein n=1 Tax=Croceivirga sp. JEA036 TaxID=2721162 RepID=UPI00143B6A15|nr:hypothetical protein [Croceivirga sp. JEA036]NJB35863.1 hypothetical protein [Croceivirga sp. JEA036]
MKATKDIKKLVDKRKFKVFSLFLLCSFFAWTINKLSEAYESSVSFNVAYTQLPDSLMLPPDAQPLIPAKVKASGFKYLGYAMSAKELQLNLSQLREGRTGFYLTNAEVKRQINQQLPSNIALIDLLEEEHQVKAMLVDAKKVPVILALDLSLAHNFIMEEAVQLVPDSVLIKGPKVKLDKIHKVVTEKLELHSVNQNFKRQVALKPIENGENLEIAATSVTVKGKVVRFSEKEFVVPISPLHVPEGYQLKMFPNTVKLVCKASVDKLKEITEEDFEVFVDYNSKNEQEEQTLYIELGKDPEGVYSVKLVQNKVEFVLEKE